MFNCALKNSKVPSGASELNLGVEGQTLGLQAAILYLEKKSILHANETKMWEFEFTFIVLKNRRMDSWAKMVSGSEVY